MGEINNEQAVVYNRKNRLKDVDADIRDQIPAKLAEKLDEMGVGDKVVKIWQIGNANRTMWLERQQIYLQDWDEFMAPTSEGPFTGVSNLHLPLPLIICKTVHARFMQALIGIDPPFTVEGRTEAEVERAQLIQSLMRYILLEHANYYDGIEDAVDRWLWDWVTTGSAILKARWECLYERYVDVEEYTKPGVPTYRTDPTTGKQTMHQLPRKASREKVVTEKTFEGVLYEKRNMEDVLITGGNGDPQLADSVIDRYFLTASDIWHAVDKKLFREEAAQQVVAGGLDHTMGAIAGYIKLQRANDAGKSVIRSPIELDRYEILECYMKLDVDGSGINSEIVVWVHYRSRVILRANYLRRMIKTGERPFFKIDFHLRQDAEFGVGLVEMMHPLTVELDALRNMRLDFGLLSTMPFGFYRPTSNLNPEILQLEPGSLIPVDNPQADIYFPNLGNRTAWGFQEEQAIYTMVERITSINDLNQAVMSGAQGPTRTATGAKALLGESNANLDIFLRRMNRGWRRLLKFTFHMLQQRIQPGFQFRILGDDGNNYWGQIKSREELRGMYDFQIQANSSASNPQIQEDNANAILQITANPLDMQMGIITPAQRYEALKNWFKVKQVKDFNRYIQKPKGYEYIPTPMEEVNRLLHGIEVPVAPNSDHQGFIDFFQHIMQTKELLGQFPPQSMLILKRQMLKHQQMLHAMQQQAQQQKNMMQMQMNAQAATGQPPTPQGPPQMGAQQATSPMAAGGGAAPDAGSDAVSVIK